MPPCRNSHVRTSFSPAVKKIIWPEIFSSVRIRWSRSVATRPISCSNSARSAGLIFDSSSSKPGGHGHHRHLRRSRAAVNRSGLRFVVGRVDDHQPRLLAQQAEGAGDLLLLVGHVRLAQRLARLHRRQHDLQRGVLVLQLLVLRPRQRLLERILDAVDAVGDDLHVGQHEVFVEASGGRPAGSVPSKAATTNTRQPASRIIAIRVALPSCVRLRPGVSTSSSAASVTFFGMVDLAERLDARVGDGGHGALAGVGQRRIGRHARQPVEQRALARSLIADQSDFHGLRSSAACWPPVNFGQRMFYRLGLEVV